MVFTGEYMTSAWYSLVNTSNCCICCTADKYAAPVLCSCQHLQPFCCGCVNYNHVEKKENGWRGTFCTIMLKGKWINEVEYFGIVDDDFVKVMAATTENTNTKKLEEKCERIILNWLKSAKEEDSNYWDWSVEKLNVTLSCFWLAAWNVEGDYYHVSSLKHIQYALNCCLQRHSIG